MLRSLLSLALVNTNCPDLTISAYSKGSIEATLRPALREAMIAGCLALVICAVGALQLPLIGQDEGRFAQAAREMSLSGDWVVPSFGGEPRYDKPILIYWLTMLSYAIFGFSAWAARLPSQIAAAALVALVAFWVRRRFVAGRGLLAGLLLLSCPVFFIEARASTADMVMLLPAMLAMLLLENLWSAEGERTRRHKAVLFWALMAGSVLAKGPIGPAVVLATLVALWAFERTWLRWERIVGLALIALGYASLGPVVLIVPLVFAFFSERTRRRVAALEPLWGAPVFFVLVMPWALAAHVQSGGAFFADAIAHHVLERGLVPLESHGGFPGFYFVAGMIVLFPWFGALISRLWQWDEMLQDWTSRFFASWLIGTFVMLEMMQTRMAHYLLPCVVAGVLLLVGRPPKGNVFIVSFGAMGAFALASVPIVAVEVLDLETLRLPALGVILPLAAGTGWIVLRVRTTREAISERTLSGQGEEGWRPLTIVAASSLVFLLALVGFFIPLMAETFIVGKTAAEVDRILQSGEDPVVFKLRDDELLFSLPPETRVVRSREGLAAKIASGEPFLGITRERDLQVLMADSVSFQVEAVGEVEGVDLSRGRWTKNVFFRVAP